MPIYVYRCTTCGFQKEYLQKMSDARLTDCPKCGTASLRKMVTAARFRLKGSGWYATDFKNGSQTKSKSQGKPAAKTGDKPAAKSEDKPASAAPAKKPDAAAPSPATGTGASPV